MSDLVKRNKTKINKQKEKIEEEIIQINISSLSDDISQSKNNNLDDEEIKGLSIKNNSVIKNLNQNLRIPQKKRNTISNNSYNNRQENEDPENMVINLDEIPNSQNIIISSDFKINKNYKEDKNSSLIKIKDNEESNLIKNIVLNEENLNPPIFFFIDKNAGNEKGKILLNMGIYKIQFSKELNVISYFFDMNDKEENGIKELEKQLLKLKYAKVIICGEDFTIYKFISKLNNNNNINLNKIFFGVLPIGHSNDISRQLGFGDYYEISSDMLNLKNIIKEINESCTTLIDIWDIKLTCDSKEGGIIFNEENKKTFKKTKNGEKLTILRHGFIGYFSLGYDGRIGFGASKKKSKFKCCHNLFLLWEKVKKCIFQKTIKLKGFIDSFYVINLPKEDFNNSIDCETDCTAMENEGRKIPIFQTKKNIENDNKNHIENDSDYCDIDDSLKTFQFKKIVLKGDPIGLVCQNIKYFFDGEQSDWSLNNQKYGIETYEMIDSKDKNAKEVIFLFFLIFRLRKKEIWKFLMKLLKNLLKVLMIRN